MFSVDFRFLRRHHLPKFMMYDLPQLLYVVLFAVNGPSMLLPRKSM